MSVPTHEERAAALAALDRAGGELPLRSLARFGGGRLIGADAGQRALIVRGPGSRARITDTGLRALLRAEGFEPYEPRGQRIAQ